jgi:hypothetical protein
MDALVQTTSGARRPGLTPVHGWITLVQSISQPGHAMSRRLDATPSARRAARLPHALRLALLAGFGFAFAAMPAAATMYKWVDANGKTVYSDQPPPANVKSEIIKPPPPPSNPDAVKDMVNADTELKMREKQRVEDAKAADKKAADLARRQEMCTNALAQIRTLQRDDIYRFDAKGERVYLDAEARRQETDLLQKILRENCTGLAAN